MFIPYILEEDQQTYAASSFKRHKNHLLHKINQADKNWNQAHV